MQGEGWCVPTAGPPSTCSAADWMLPFLGGGLSSGRAVSHPSSLTLLLSPLPFLGPMILAAHADHPLWVLPQTTTLLGLYRLASD